MSSQQPATFGKSTVPPVIRGAVGGIGRIYGAVPQTSASPSGYPFHVWVNTGLGLVAVAVLFFFDPSVYHFYPLCLFHRFTGLLCPGCGSLRALHALFSGHFASALRFNGLLVLCLPFLSVYGCRRLLYSVRGKPTPKLQRIWVLGVIVAAITFGVLRNLPGIFEFLRP